MDLEIINSFSSLMYPFLKGVQFIAVNNSFSEQTSLNLKLKSISRDNILKPKKCTIFLLNVKFFLTIDLIVQM